jgi:hypothetical protein
MEACCCAGSIGSGSALEQSFIALKQYRRPSLSGTSLKSSVGTFLTKRNPGPSDNLRKGV